MIRTINNEKGDAAYWKYETPVVIETEKNVLRYYPIAKKLTVHLPDFYKCGELRPGKGVGLALDALTAPQLQQLINILEAQKQN